MKSAQLLTATKEGFVSRYILKFDNDLELSTKNLLWVGKAEHDNTVNKLKELIEQLNQAGVTVNGDFPSEC